MTDGPNETGSFRRQIPPEGHVTLRFEKFSSFVDEYRACISLGGVFIKTHRPRPVGSDVHFEFKLTDGFRLLHGQGSVLWVRGRDLSLDEPAGMGVRFTAIDESGRQLVLKLLEEQVKAGGAPFEVDNIPANLTNPPDAGDSDQSAEPDLGEEATLIGASIQDLNPELPTPVMTPPPEQAELGFDAPWGKQMPGVPSDLIGEESDPEVDKAVSKIRPLPTGAELAAAAEARAAEAAQQADAAPQAEPPQAFAAPPVSSNTEATPVAPPIAQPPPAATAALPDPQFELDSLTEEPTLVGMAPPQTPSVAPSPQQPPAAPAPPAAQAELPLTGLQPEALPSADLSGSIDRTPAVQAPASLEGRGEVSLEDSMMEAADEVESTVELDEPVVDFAPAPEDISFDVEPAAGSPTFGAESGSARDPLEVSTTAELPAFEDPGAPTFEDPGAPTFEAPESPTFDPAPAASPTFDTPAPTFDSSPDPSPGLEAPGFETPAAAPALEAVLPVEEPGLTAAPVGGDGSEAPSAPAFFETREPTSASSFDASPAPTAAALESPAAAFPPSGSPAAFPETFDTPEQSAAGSPSMDGGGSALFAPTAEAPADQLGVQTVPGQPHAADFVDSWPQGEEEPSGSWMEEDHGIERPTRRGAGRQLIALAAVVALVAGVYFFRDTLMGLVGLGSSSSGPQSARLGPPPETPSGDLPALVPENDGASVDTEEGPPLEEQIKVSGDEATANEGLELDVRGDLDATEDLGAPAPEPTARGVDPEPAEGPAEEPRSVTPPRSPPTATAVAQAPAPQARVSAVQAGLGRAIAGIEWSNVSQGTRVTIRFNRPLSSGDFVHDSLAWAGDREMVTLYGVQNYLQNEVVIGSNELRRIRVGFHPGNELRLVFDLSRNSASIQDLKVDGSNLEILLQ